MIVKINVSLRNAEREVISCDDAGGGGVMQLLQKH